MKNHISLRINGKEEKISEKEALLGLADYLRQVKFLKGTKVVCSEGDCGACTVLIKTPFDSQFKSANSCILPIYTLDYCEILTIDGLKQNHDKLYEKINDELFKQLGTQCGFCTPGFIMQIRAMTLAPNSEKMISCLSGKHHET